MRYWWMIDRADQKQFRYYWGAGKTAGLTDTPSISVKPTTKKIPIGTNPANNTECPTKNIGQEASHISAQLKGVLDTPYLIKPKPNRRS